MTDRNLLLAKVEASYGVDSVAAAANVMWAENVQFKIVAQKERGAPSKPGVGQVKGHVYGEHATLSFDVPLAASGTAGTAPKWGPLMLSCGWAETLVATTSVTYALAPDPQAATSQTIVWRDGRRLHKIVGWRGRVGLKVSVGKRPMLSFSGKGLYTAVTTAALPLHADATWTGWNDAKPIAQGRTTFSLEAVALPVRDLSFDASDNVLFNDLPHQENVTLRGARTFSGSLKATTPLPSALNLETVWQSATVAVAQLVHESAAGNVVTVNIKAQLGEPDYSDDKGEDVFSSALDLTPSALNVDDEVSIVLT